MSYYKVSWQDLHRDSVQTDKEPPARENQLRSTFELRYCRILQFRTNLATTRPFILVSGKLGLDEEVGLPDGSLV